MIEAEKPHNEANRLATLLRYHILDTKPEKSFQEVTQLAKDLVNVPVAYIAFLDADRLWLKSCIGTDVSEVPREISFCSHTVTRQDYLIVPDTHEDPRFVDNPLVTNPPHLRFYAGFPIKVEQGHTIGTLCVVDTEPRSLTDHQINTLELLSRLVTEKLELRRSQYVFSEAEAWYKILFHKSDDAKILYNSGLEIIEANKPAFNLFGLEEVRFLGSHISDIFLQKDQQKGINDIKNALGGKQIRSTMMLVDVNGSPFPAECIYNMFESDGEKIGHLTVRDMTAQNALDLALQESQLLFENVQTLAHIGSWAYFPESDRTIWSKEVFNITGYPKEKGTPTYEEYLNCIPEHERQHFIEATQEALKSGKPYQFEHQIIQQDGSLKWVASQGQGLIGRDGKVEKLFGAIQDINERKIAEEEMLESQQRLKFHLMQSPLGYIEWDLNFNVVEWNPACERIFGFEKEEILGSLPAIVPEHLIEEVGKIFVSLMKGEGGMHSINENITKKGDKIICEWANTSVRSSSGEIVAISSIVQDITERTESEAALKQYAEQLEKAKTAAEMADKAKSTFLANMSHEIRTPMNGVIGMTSLLEQTGLDKEQNEYVSIIKRSGESLLNLINDILDFSKLDANRVEIEQRIFTLQTCIDQSVELVRSHAAEKDIPIYFEPKGNLPYNIISDSKRLGQILNNLLANAVKFTLQGHIILEVSYKDVSPFAGELQFAITDTGIGIPEEKQNRLFKAFSQVDASTTRRYGGTGLGLKISSRLVELMGGRIWVESQENVGSTFYFTIQCTIDRTSHQSTSRLLNGKRILVADPLATNQEYYEHLLSSWGMEVSAAGTKEDLVQIRDHSVAPDVVLLDDELTTDKPHQTKYEIARIFPECAVFYVHWLNERYHDASFDAILTKPVLVSALYEALCTHFLASLQKTEAAKTAESKRLHFLIVDDNAINGAITERMLHRPEVHAQYCSNFNEVKEASQENAVDAILIDRELKPSSIQEILHWIHSHFEDVHRPLLFCLDATKTYEFSVSGYGTGFDLTFRKPLHKEDVDQIISICYETLAPNQISSPSKVKSSSA